MTSRLRSLIDKPPRLPVTRLWVVALATFLICVLAYGLLLPGMGFYWDDWPWIWMTHVSGPTSLLSIDQPFRPLAGVILWLDYQLAGIRPLGWQILNLAYRWLAGLALFWALVQLWPSQKKQVLWVTLLFLVYPGFNQQFISVNSSRHILPQVFFFLSIGSMLGALRRKRAYLWLTALALAFSLAAMLSTEYYYGLELVRPVVIWLALDQEKKGKKRLLGTLLHWLPYLLVLAGIFAWRYSLAQHINYPITLTASLAAHPIQALKSALKILAKNIRLASLSAYATLFDFPQIPVIGELNVRIYWLLVALSAFLAGSFLILSQRQDRSNRWWWQAILLGASALLVGSLPFLVTGIDISLSFPHSRTLLPMMLGTSLLIAGLVDALPGMNWAKIAVVSALVGLSVGAHFQNALVYRQDWAYQKSVFWQLYWRAPALEPGTALVTTELPITRSTDNSLTAPLNWIYARQPLEGQLPYLVLYLRQRVDTDFHRLPIDKPLESGYGKLFFNGSTNQILSIYDNYPGCLMVLHPKFDAQLPHLPLALKWSLSQVKLKRITTDPAMAGSLPLGIFGPEPSRGWCYYFEKADLARQMGDWGEVVHLGDMAFQYTGERQRSSENLPFIQGYAYLGRWSRVEELTLDTLASDEELRPMLCVLWRDVAKHTPQSQQKDQTLQKLETVLGCDGN